jgi:hypothetical protein
MALAGHGTTAMKLGLRDRNGKLLIDAASSLAKAIPLLDPEISPEQWAGARVNLATIQSMIAKDPWKDLLKAAEISLPVVTSVSLEAAPDERKASLEQLSGWYYSWLKDYEGKVLPVHVYRELDRISGTVLGSLDPGSERDAIVQWLQFRGLSCMGGLESVESAADATAKAYSQLLNFLTKEENPEIWAKAQQNLGASLQRAKTVDLTTRLYGSVQALRSCLEIYTEEAYPEKYRENSRNLGLAAFNLGCHLRDLSSLENEKEARWALHLACEHLQKNGSAVDFSRATNALGLFYLQRSGDPYENNEHALHCFVAATIEKEDEPELWADLEANQGVCLADRIHMDVGRFEYVSARPIPGDPDEVYLDGGVKRKDVVEMRFGGGLSKEDGLQKAAKAFDNALTVFQEETHPERWATTSAYLATVYLEIARLPLRRTEEEARRKQEEAILILERVTAHLREIGPPEELHRCLWYLATAHSERLEGDLLTNLLTSAAMFRQVVSQTPASNHDSRLNFAVVLLRLIEMGRRELEAEFVAYCQSLERNFGNEDYESRRRIHHILGDYHWFRADVEPALEHYQRAIEAGEVLFRNSLTLASKNLAHEGNIPLYRSAIACCLALKGEHLRNGFLYADRLHSAVFSSEVCHFPASPPKNVPAELCEREKRLLEGYRTLMLMLEADESTVKRSSMVGSIGRIHQDLQKCWNEMGTGPELDGYLRFRRTEPATWNDFLRWSSDFKDHTFGIVFCLNDKTVILAARPGIDLPLLIECPLPRAQLQDCGRDFNTRFIALDPYDDIPIDGWLEELSPLASALAEASTGSNGLILLVDSPISGIPLHSIMLDGKPLIAVCPLAYVPSFATSLWLNRFHKRKENGSWRKLSGSDVLVIGNPTEDLPDAEMEARTVAAIFGVEPILGRQATKDVLIHGLKTKRIVHVAGHADFSEVSPFDRGLHLFGDVILSSHDILAETFSCELFVVSSCSSARQRIASSGERLGFPRACLSSGVGSLIAGLWSVEDPVALSFMTAFYESLAKNHGRMDQLKALHSGCAHLWAKAMPAYSWAPFILYGLPEPTPAGRV